MEAQAILRFSLPIHAHGLLVHAIVTMVKFELNLCLQATTKQNTAPTARLKTNPQTAIIGKAPTPSFVQLRDACT